MPIVVELDIEIPDEASVEVETPDVEITPSSGETVLLVATPGEPGQPGPPGAGFQVFGEEPIGVKDGVNLIFTTLELYRDNTLAVYINGSRQQRGFCYNETGPNTITFIDPLLSDDSITVDYIVE